MADKAPNFEKKPGRHLYDDEKLENMLHYYKIEDNYESLLRYIKNRGIIDDDSEEE
ncbi:MAG: hypothetical protein QXJ74_05410 [Nitrososphaera sp.]